MALGTDQLEYGELSALRLKSFQSPAVISEPSPLLTLWDIPVQSFTVATSQSPFTSFWPIMGQTPGQG